MTSQEQLNNIINGYKLSVAEKNLRISGLEETLRLTHKDLLMRAEEDSSGCKVVGLSSFVWGRVKEALKEKGND